MQPAGFEQTWENDTGRTQRVRVGVESGSGLKERVAGCQRGGQQRLLTSVRAEAAGELSSRAHTAAVGARRCDEKKRP